MPITFGQEVPRINYGEYMPPPKEQGPGFAGTIASAFRLENDVLNLIDYASQPLFPDQEGFDPGVRARDSLFWRMSPDSFIGVRSDAEWNFMESKLSQELKDRAAIEAAGVGGIAAAMAAGVLSPTILIPVGNAATATRVATAAARTAAWTAFGVGLQEGILHLNQETRTVEESAFAIGGGAVLGGLLGAGVRYLDPLDMDRIAEDMVRSPGKQAISPLVPPSAVGGEPVGLSAQATPEELLSTYRALGDPEGLAPAFSPKIDQMLSRLGPVSRGLFSRYSGRRMFTAQFGGAGIHTKASLRGEVGAEGGDLENLVKSYEAARVQATIAERQLYRDWYLKSGGTKLGSAFAIRSQKEFAELTGQALFSRARGEANNLPEEVNKAADIYLDTVFRPFVMEAKHAGLPPFGRISDDYALDMVLQKVSRFKTSQDVQAVKQIIYENALEQLQESKLKAEKLASQGIVDQILRRTNPALRARVNPDDARLNLGQLDNSDLEFLAESLAEELLQKHLSNGMRHGAVDILQEIGEKEAKYVYINPTRIWGNGRAWQEFLEQDVERLAGSFTRSIAPDIELYRKFKANFRTGEEFNLTTKKYVNIPEVKQFIEELDAATKEADKLEGKAREKAFAAIQQEREEFVRDANVLIGRLRHTWGQPADPTAVGHRLGKFALQLNTMRLMGSVVLSSIPDLARPVLKYGFMTTMRDGLMPMFREFKNFRMSMKEAQYAGTAIDLYTHGRMMSWASQFEETEYYGNIIERASAYGTSRMGIIAGFDYWNQALKGFSANLVVAELSRSIEAAAKGTLTKKDLRILGGLNVTEDQAKRIYALMERGGGTRMNSGILLPNTEDWLRVTDEDLVNQAAEIQRVFNQTGDLPVPWKKKNPPKEEDFKKMANSVKLKERQELLRTFRAAITKGVDDTIITPGLERPNWMDGSTLGLLIGQFRSFTLSSTFKTVMAAAQDTRAGNMAPVANGMMFSLALGAVSYYIWAQTAGGQARERMLNELEGALNGDEKAMARWADEAIARSGFLGVMAEAQKFAERTPGIAPYATLAGVPPARSPYLNPAMELMGPWLGAVENLGRIAVTVDDPTSESFRAAKQLMPFQNIFWLRRFFDGLNESAMDAAGVSYR